MNRPPRKPRSLVDVLGTEEISVAAPAPAAAPEPMMVSRPDRLVGVVQQMWESDRDRLKQLSLHERISVQQLGMEAWNLLLAKRGLPPIKPATANTPSGMKRE